MRDNDMCAKKTIAIVPGSFDPITNGHVFIIEEAAKRYDKIYVAVMINSNKQYTFNLEERKNIAIAALKNISNVEVISSERRVFLLQKWLRKQLHRPQWRLGARLSYRWRAGGLLLLQWLSGRGCSF